MSEESQKLYRLQHLVPRLVQSAASANSNSNISEKDNSLEFPKEVEFHLTWGKIAAKIWGPEDGQPVICIPGWLDNAATFDTLIPLLPKNLRMVAIDPPGHGLSDAFPPDIVYNYLDSMLAIERLAKQMNWDKFSLMGHSMGAGLAMVYSGIFPNRVNKLICLDLIRATPTKTETVDLRLRKTVTKLLQLEKAIIAGPEKPMSYKEAVDKTVSGTLGSLNEKACHILFKRGLKKVEGGYVYARDRRLLAAPLSFIPKKDQLILAQKVLADVLIIKYSEGPYFERVEDYLEHVEALKSGSAKIVQYVEVPGKHHAHLTNPENVAPLIANFFSNPK